ncbi:MAG: AraC family transcriptional regulator [Pseudomonadales bacterium]|nr:AraC family transcriptional regulator [Pseudomonadales bacterium]
MLGALPVWAERLTGQRFDVHSVWFSQSEPYYADKFHEHFDCEVLFNSPYDALWASVGFLELPVLSASPRYHAKIKEQASEHLQSIETVSMAIKTLLLSGLPEEISVEEVSKSLNLSERTLQRKLAEEKTNFKALKQVVRKEEAIRLLETTKLSIEQIAFNLGYEQRSSFSAAFLRWTGVTPAKWRE